ncbi:MAG: hypothetical protein GY799_00340, partial [Desulfobulbaceae bacterium]|nr:hypothetical protein [Desulfobulbaceae bacterium]
WIYALGKADIVNSTFDGNRVTASNGMGGGLSLGIIGQADIANCTFANNYAWFHGGGIQASSSSTTTLANTLFYYNESERDWGNYQMNREADADGGGNLQFPAERFNQSGTPSDGKVTPTVIIADPLLGNLADNGGPTMTMALQSGSPAIDEGSASYCTLADQRGLSRDGVCDIGAFEYKNSQSAEITTPSPGSQLNSTSVTFTWNSSGADQYWLWIGTSSGANDVYSDDQGTNTSVAVSDLPRDGETLYVRLWSKVNGEWFYSSDNTYNACNCSSSVAAIQNPSSGSALASDTETLTWNNSGATQYWLWIGTSSGGNDVYNENQGTNTSVAISGLPHSGETLYARLWSKVNGTWLYNSDYTYTACNHSSSIAGIQSPASGSALGSTSETFTWNNTGASQYWLWIGTSAGSNDVYNGNQATNTSAVISGLPSSGETLYVRLWSKVSGTWFYDSDSTYTAVGP